MSEAAVAPKATQAPSYAAPKESIMPAAAQLDNRASTVAQFQMQQAIVGSPSQVAPRQAVVDINNSPRQVAQRQAAAPLQARPNRTGLPDNLKAGVENLSGHSLDDVQVHYNSAKPAQLQAHAYAQGAEIHLAPGQEKHLPHEAWHVVQQKQGRVRATTQLKGVGVNDDSGLEKEADVMGERAADIRELPGLVSSPAKVNTLASTTVQRVVWEWLLGAAAVGSLVAGGTYYLFGGKKGEKNNSSADEKLVDEKTNQPPSLNNSPAESSSASELKTEITHTSGYVTDSKENHHEVGNEVKAKLAVDDEVKGSATDANWTWMQDLRYKHLRANVVRGHLLNHDLGGFGTPENLYPISTRANRNHSVEVEQKVKALMKGEILKITKPDGPKRILYTVKVEETVPHDPTDAKFVCSYGLEGEGQSTKTITSNLKSDTGGFLKTDTAKENPLEKEEWYHAERKGVNNEQKPTWNDYQATKKINVNSIKKIVDVKLEENKKVSYGKVDSKNIENIFDQLTADGGIFKDDKGFSTDVQRMIAKKLGKSIHFKNEVIAAFKDTESYQEIGHGDEIKLLMAQIVGEQLKELESLSKSQISDFLNENKITTKTKAKDKLQKRPAKIKEGIAMAVTSVNEYEKELSAIVKKLASGT